MSKFDRLQTFVRVVTEGSFAACAKKQGISSAAVSKQISVLEEELGFILLERTTRRLALTDAGRTYFEGAKKIIHELAVMDALAQEVRAEPMGQLKVAAQPHFAQSFIIKRLPQFLKSFPKIRLTLELMERFPDLEREKIDICIGMSRPVSLDCIQKTIGYTHYVLCASPGYLKRFGTPKKPSDLHAHRYINHTRRTPVNEVLGIYVEPYLLLNDTNAMKECALSGLGIVKLHAYVVEEALKKGKLVEILPEFKEPKQPILVNYPPHKYVPPKIRCFLDFFTATQ
jgi:DNA-binding transcriptional LysR family regulator